MDFLKFLKDYEKEDVSVVAGIVESNKSKEAMIIKEAFNSDYPSKREALFNLNNYFVEDAKAPKGIDVSYAKANLVDLQEKIEQLNEGDIRIIIHNHEDSKGGESEGVGFEEAKPKKKRGRPSKVAAPLVGAVVEPEVEVLDNEPSAELDALVTDTNETPADDEAIEKEIEVGGDAPIEEPGAEDIVSEPVADEDILLSVLDGVDTGVEEERDFGVTGKPTKLRWSDIVARVADQNDEREGLVGKLSEMELNDEELQLATEMAESGEIVEDGGRISEAAGLIGKIKNM